MKTKRFSIIAILIIVAVLATACSGGTAAPAATPGGTAATTTATAKPTATAQPAGKVYKYTLQGCLAAPGTDNWERLEGSFIKYVDMITNGQVQISGHGPGEIVPFGEMSTATQQGTLDIIEWLGYYDLGRDPTCALMCTAPFGLSGDVFQSWMDSAGGYELCESLYNQWNMHVISGYAGGTGQILGQTKKPYYGGMSEWKEKGLIIRSSGVQGDVYTKAGFQVVFISGGDLFTAAERGVVDVIEFGGPTWNWKYGYQEICPYVYYPGWHEPATNLTFMMNMDRWNELPVDLQEKVALAGKATRISNVPIDQWETGVYLQKMVDYGCEFIKISDADLAMMYDAKMDLFTEIAAGNARFKEMWDSMEAYRAEQDEVYRVLSDLSFDPSLSKWKSGQVS